jgi:hypothetical protein
MRSLLMGGLDFDVCVRDTLDVVLGRARASIITMLRVSSSQLTLSDRIAAGHRTAFMLCYPPPLGAPRHSDCRSCP